MEKLKQAIGALCDTFNTPAGFALEFCEWTSDEQAAFLVEVARIMDGWEGAGGAVHRMWIGDAMRGPDSHKQLVRDMLRDILESAEAA